MLVDEVQPGLFGQADEESSAVAYLRGLGYIVVPPSKYMKGVLNDRLYKTITSSKKLVEFFYARLYYYNKDRLEFFPSPSKQDMSLAKRFVEGRMDSGVGKNRALIECALIIDYIFKNEEAMGLDEPIRSMSILGQNKLKWVTDKAINQLENHWREKEKTCNILAEEDSIRKQLSAARKRYGNQSKKR